MAKVNEEIRIVQSIVGQTDDDHEDDDDHDNDQKRLNRFFLQTLTSPTASGTLLH